MRAGRLVLPTLHLEQVGVNEVANVLAVERLFVLLDLLRDEVMHDLHVLLEQFQAKQVSGKLLQNPIKYYKAYLLTLKRHNIHVIW